MARKASSSISKSRQLVKHGKTKDADVNNAEDKTSELPDAILCHILSFFPTTKDAVQTSILSRRWRYVWTSVPCIVLKYSYLKSHINLDLKTRIAHFTNYVDRVMHLNQSSHLRKLSLDCRQIYDLPRLNEWISNVINRLSVEELDLCSHQHFELPLRIFTSKKLVSLKLGSRNFSLNPPPSVCLPSLKTIHLSSVQLCNDDSMKNLLDGCPVLEEFKYSNINDYFGIDDHITTTLFIRSSSLKRLKLSLRYQTINQIVVEAPNLERLEIGGWVTTEKFYVNYLSSLVEVELSLRFRSDRPVKDEVYCNKIFELLGKMSNTKYMTLSCNTMLCLRQALLIDTLPIFHNLIDLTVLDDDTKSCGQVLPYLLECSPNLINFCYGSSYKLQCRKPKCLMSYLEKTTLLGFKGRQGEMKMIMYFLKNAPVLKEMSICYNFSSSIDVSKIFERLSKLPRRSTACRIEVVKSREE